MTPNKMSLLRVSIIALLAITAIVVAMRISPFSCCSCPPEHYDFYPLSTYFMESLSDAGTGCISCNPLAGCTYSFWIIPSDIIAIATALSIVYAALRFREKKPKR